MSGKQQQQTERFVYVKDPALCVTGITQLEDAIVVKDRLIGQYPEPTFRVRNRYRSRTGMWDVLVKRRTSSKDVLAKSVADQKAATETTGES